MESVCVCLGVGVMERDRQTDSERKKGVQRCGNGIQRRQQMAAEEEVRKLKIYKET